MNFYDLAILTSHIFQFYLHRTVIVNLKCAVIFNQMSKTMTNNRNRALKQIRLVCHRNIALMATSINQLNRKQQFQVRWVKPVLSVHFRDAFSIAFDLVRKFWVINGLKIDKRDLWPRTIKDCKHPLDTMTNDVH